MRVVVEHASELLDGGSRNKSAPKTEVFVCTFTKATEHLFKECITWKEGIMELWKEIGEISGHAETRGNVSARRYKERKGFFLGKMQGESRGKRGPGNTSIRELMADRRFIGPVLRFLRIMIRGLRR